MNLIDDAVCRPPTNTLTQQPEFRIRDDTAVLPHTEACGRPRHPDDPADRLTALRAQPLRSDRKRTNVRLLGP